MNLPILDTTTRWTKLQPRIHVQAYRASCSWSCSRQAGNRNQNRYPCKIRKTNVILISALPHEFNAKCPNVMSSDYGACSWSYRLQPQSTMNNNARAVADLHTLTFFSDFRVYVILTSSYKKCHSRFLKSQSSLTLINIYKKNINHYDTQLVSLDRLLNIYFYNNFIWR